MSKLDNMKDVVGFRDYSVTEDGRVYSKRAKKYLSTVWKGNRDVRYNLCVDGKKFCVLAHRIVAMAYIPNPNNYAEVNHIDGNPKNNHVSNLEWVTRSMNIRHGFDTGLITPSQKGRLGAKNKNSKAVLQLTMEGEIVAEYGSLWEASRMTGLSQGTIWPVVAKRGYTAGGYKWEYKCDYKTRKRKSLKSITMKKNFTVVSPLICFSDHTTKIGDIEISGEATCSHPKNTDSYEYTISDIVLIKDEQRHPFYDLVSVLSNGDVYTNILIKSICEAHMLFLWSGEQSEPEHTDYQQDKAA